MGLRNAFDEMGLEGTLRKILNAVTYARTPQDQMRVVVDSAVAPSNTPVQITAINAGQSVNVNNANNTGSQATAAGPGYWGSNTWNAMDARETARLASETQFIMTRQRWSII